MLKRTDWVFWTSLLLAICSVPLMIYAVLTYRIGSGASPLALISFTLGIGAMLTLLLTTKVRLYFVKKTYQRINFPPGISEKEFKRRLIAVIACMHESMRSGEDTLYLEFLTKPIKLLETDVDFPEGHYHMLVNKLMDQVKGYYSHQLICITILKNLQKATQRWQQQSINQSAVIAFNSKLEKLSRGRYVSPEITNILLMN